MKLAFLLAAAALAMGGCTKTDDLANRFAAGVGHAAYDINAINAALQDPATQAAIAEFKAGATMLTCTFSSASAETAAISAVLSNSSSGGVAAIKHSSTVAYVISGSLCPAMGGTTAAPVVVKASDIPATTKTQ